MINAHPVHQIVLLGDHPDAASHSAQMPAMRLAMWVAREQDTTGLESDKAADRPEQGGLAGAARADDGNAFACPDGQRDVAQYGRGTSPVSDGQVLDRQHATERSEQLQVRRDAPEHIVFVVGRPDELVSRRMVRILSSRPCCRARKALPNLSRTVASTCFRATHT